MSFDLEEDLHRHFHEKAQDAPVALRVRDRTLAAVRMQRVRRAALPALGVAACLVAAMVWLVPTPTVTPGPTAEAGGEPALTQGQHGSIDAGGLQGLCRYTYSPSSPQDIARADFAFAGNVTQIEPPTDKQDLYSVTFDVVEWFTSDEGSRVVVEMTAPSGFADTEEFIDAYEDGTSMLVSGSKEQSTYEAWTCGFTRYYERKVADLWRLHT